jgi:hypothetical protein
MKKPKQKKTTTNEKPKKTKNKKTIEIKDFHHPRNSQERVKGVNLHPTVSLSGNRIVSFIFE